MPLRPRKNTRRQDPHWLDLVSELVFVVYLAALAAVVWALTTPTGSPAAGVQHWTVTNLPDSSTSAAP